MKVKHYTKLPEEYMKFYSCQLNQEISNTQ